MSRGEIPDSLIWDWFTIGKSVPKIEISTYTQKLRALRKDDDETSSVRSDSIDPIAYARVYQEAEEKEALKVASGAGRGPSLEADLINGLDFGRGRFPRRLNETEELTSTNGCFPLVAELLSEETVRVYKTYDFNRILDNQLPISKYKEMILNMIECSRVTIIQGSTGSGKTTQVPQYILEKYASEERHCNIIVTQPRRIAAISIARRVADERGWGLGSMVGYQVGLDRAVSQDTRLTYVTTGVLLQKLVNQKSLNDYTHVILDEIHERDMESDFLMLVVRKLSRTVSKETSVVLMSATVDVDMFADYFSTPVGDRMLRASIVSVKGKTFPVFEFWLDSLTGLGHTPRLDVCEPCIPTQSIVLAHKLITAFDSFEVIEQKEKAEFATSRGTVLVFLPGIEEINGMYKELISDKILLKWEIIPLHSTITWDEQKKVFNRPEPGYRKIILSTNIAESSITVPDIKYVIDFCLTKSQVCDSTTNYSWLQLEWASKAHCEQRKGRAGRVSNGRVYRMITKEFYDLLPEYGTPEMKRCSLHQAVLHSKLLDMGEPKAILGLALDPPDLTDIERTILMLMEVGALAARSTERGIISSQDGDLTYVGRIISMLPIDVHLGKLVVLGHIFGCLEECVIIAAGLSQKSVFSRPYNAPLNAYKGKMEWADGSFSDCIALLNVYKIWQEQKKNNYFSRPGGMSEKKWGARSLIQIPRLYEVEKLVKELTSRLSGQNLRIQGKSQMRDAFERSLLLKIVIAGAFYPHYFTQGQLDEKEISREVGGFDPHATVTLSGLPPDHGMLYAKAIKAMLAACGSQMNIHFDHSRAYVEFLRPTTAPGDSKQNTLKGAKIPPEMFLAIKMRQLRLPLELRVISTEEAMRQLRQLNMLPVTEEEESETTEGSECGSTRSSMKHLRTNRITTLSHSALQKVQRPGLHQTIIEIYVTEVVHASHFWAIYGSSEDKTRMEYMEQLIKDNIENYDLPMIGVLTPGQICLAPYHHVYYRARVESVVANSIEVFFVDYGNTLKVKKSDLRAINGKAFPDLLSIPMQAFECVLCKLQPSSVTCPSGLWSKEANDFVQRAIGQQSIHGRVYSVVHGVIHLEVIYSRKKNSTNTSLNDELKRLGYGESAEEDLLSEQNYKLRHQMHSELTVEDEDNPRDVQISIFPDEDQLLKLAHGGRKHKLHGPFSPLEMSFCGLTKASSVRSVRIEPDSVNSIAIDNDFRDEHARLLVASDVTLNASGNSLVARSTTLLPNIHGLVHLIVLMFSPRVEFRTDRERRRYTGALCGLGYQESTGYSLFPENDMELVFDTQLTQDDIIMINKIRIGINVLLNANDDMDNSRTCLIQKKLQEQVLKLVCRPRQSQTPMSSTYPGRWRIVKPEYLLHPELDGTEADILHVLPLLSGIALNEPVERVQLPATLPPLLREDLVKHVKELHACASKSSQYQLIMCRLCGQTVDSPRDLLLHLQTAKHKKVEYQLFIGENKASS